MNELHKAIKELLESRAKPTGDCIVWNGARIADGYGMVKIARKAWGVHRIVWLIERGEIPAGLSVCHHCDTPACIKIDHLFLGTQADNNADRHRKGRTKGFGRKKA